MLTGAKQRIGFASSSGRVLYTRQVPYRPDHHHAERLWSLAMSDCADPPTRDQIRPRLYPSDEDRRSIDLLLRRSGAGSSDEPFVAIAPGSAWGTKRWPYYVALATRLAEDFRIAVIGSNADSEIVAPGGLSAGHTTSHSQRDWRKISESPSSDQMPTPRSPHTLPMHSHLVA